jgi:hypothetical protein
MQRINWLLALLVAAVLPSATQAWWYFRPATITVPSEGYSAWYMGSETTLSPFTIRMKAGKSIDEYEGHTLKLVLYRDGFFNKRLAQIEYSPQDIKAVCYEIQKRWFVVINLILTHLLIRQTDCCVRITTC